MKIGLFGFPLQATVESITLLTGSGNYTVPLWARFIHVRACGGGGGGGGADGTGNSGQGAASGYVTENFFAVSPGIEIPYSCGPGGTGGAGVGNASPGNNGSNGTDTTFGRSGSDIYLIARGGRSGRGGAASPGVSGAGTNAGTNIGENGPQGAGGASPLTGVVALGSATLNVAGSDGKDGGGGGGGISNNNNNGSSGGLGGNGWIQIQVIP